MEEDPSVPAPRSREPLTLVLGGLAVGGGSRPNVIDEAEGRPGDGVERCCVVGAGLAVAARKGVGRGVEAPRTILHGEVEAEQLAEPLVLGDRGQPLVEEVLQAVVVGADQEAAPPQVGPLVLPSLYQANKLPLVGRQLDMAGGERPTEEGQGFGPLVEYGAKPSDGGVAVDHELPLEVQHLQNGTCGERLL